VEPSRSASPRPHTLADLGWSEPYPAQEPPVTFTPYDVALLASCGIRPEES